MGDMDMVDMALQLLDMVEVVRDTAHTKSFEFGRAVTPFSSICFKPALTDSDLMPTTCTIRLSNFCGHLKIMGCHLPCGFHEELNGFIFEHSYCNYFIVKCKWNAVFY